MKFRIGALSFGAAILFLTSTAFAGQIIYVDADTAGANNGSSWADAFNYLQDALSAAQSGDEIWVAEDIYKPDQGAGQTPGEREATFQLINGVALYGGFPPGGGSWQDRDPNNFETILSGDLNNNDVAVNNPEDMWLHPSRHDNSYHVVTGSGTNETAILDGFLITAGHNTGGGGGMWNWHGSPTVTNCTFTWNCAEWGGGIWNWDNSNPTLNNCTFTRNAAMGGGGVDNTENSNPSLNNCIFIGNVGAGRGGGMLNGYAGMGGSGSPTLINCKFIGNSTYGYGGGIYNTDKSCPTIINCAFSGNTAERGGGMFNREHIILTLDNCIFSGNLADWGGGIYNYGYGGECTLTLSNCTFSGNSATSGNAVACDSFQWEPSPSIVQLSNCILWDGGNEIWNDDGSTFVITYSDVYGGWPGQGNIDDDPLFVDPASGDYHLLLDSPCIDAGDNLVVEPNSNDLAGNLRIIDGDGDGEAIVDMGAYEFLPSIEADLRILPRVINRKSRGRYVLAIMRLPEGIAEEDIDADEGFVLEPGDANSIPAIRWRTAVYNEQMRVFVLFDRARLMDAVSSNGEIELTVSGQLESGQGIYGVDTIRIIGPPGEHPRGHGQPRPQGRAGGRVR